MLRWQSNKLNFRNERDLNPRYGLTVHSISNRALSATQTSFHLFGNLFLTEVLLRIPSPSLSGVVAYGKPKRLWCKEYF